MVVEQQTAWPGELSKALQGAWERERLAARLHAEPAQAAELEYIRLPVGFIRKITVTPADLDRLRSSP